MTATVDHAGFVEALDEARQERGMSWRQVASETELEPSTLQRIVAGSIPDLPRYAALIDWLSVPADAFIRRSRGRMDVYLGTGQVLEIKSLPKKRLTEGQLRHVRGAVEEIVRALDA